MLHHKKLIVTLCLTATVVFAATASMQRAAEPEKPNWKNLKVLPKNISKEDLDKTMDEWRDALGVKCGFCHARNTETNKTDFPSDAKPEKLMARKMMLMTAKINKKFFKEDKDDKEMTAAITCYVCHRGSAHPETTAPAHGQRGPGSNGKKAPADGSVPTSPVTTVPPAGK